MGISSPKDSLAPPEAVYLSKQESGYFSDELGEYEEFMELLAVSGQRYIESTALTRRSFIRVDYAHFSVRVARVSKDTANGFQLGLPKTLASVCQVTLNEALSGRMESILRKKMNGLIFTKPSGDFLRSGYCYSYHWAPALDRLLEPRPEPLLLQRPRVHDIHHSRASWLIQVSVTLPVIQKRLGHTSIKTDGLAYRRQKRTPTPSASSPTRKRMPLPLLPAPVNTSKPAISRARPWKSNGHLAGLAAVTAGTLPPAGSLKEQPPTGLSSPAC